MPSLLRGDAEYMLFLVQEINVLSVFLGCRVYGGGMPSNLSLGDAEQFPVAGKKSFKIQKN